MSNLSREQRQAIVSRYAGLVRTYFSSHELVEFTIPYQAQARLEDVEFYAYLRLATALSLGRRLPPILRRIGLAPSVAQVDVLMAARGALPGRLDVPSYVRRRGRVVYPRIFPVHRQRSEYTLPENVIAAAATVGLMAELQALLRTLPLGGSSEGSEINAIVDVLEQASRLPPVGPVMGGVIPNLWSGDLDQVAADAAERWTTRRISNVAYADLFDWTREYRQRGLGEDGLSPAVAYSEDFDDKLFEIFCLGIMRDALADRGFEEMELHPLHDRGSQPIVVGTHPSTGLRLALHFQKGATTVWTKEAPREWPEIAGVPDMAIVPASTEHPTMIIDAKNKFRGQDFSGSLSDELFKMLGYFHDFALRVRVGRRGPCGALLFLGRAGASELRTFRGASGGMLVAAAIDPCHDQVVIAGVEVLDCLLKCAGLQSTETDFDKQLQLLKVDAPAYSEDEDDDDAAVSAVLDRIHDLVAESYGTMDGPIREAQRDLELHILGTAWDQVPEDIRHLVATSEVFYAEHRLSSGIDFAPVVVELARACEILVGRWLIEPCRQWADQNGFPGPKGLGMLGQLRALLVRARDARAGGSVDEASTVRSYVSSRGWDAYALGVLIDDLGFVNHLRRRAAHKDLISGVDATGFRDRVLGIGGATPVLPRMVAILGS